MPWLLFMLWVVVDYEHPTQLPHTGQVMKDREQSITMCPSPPKKSSRFPHAMFYDTVIGGAVKKRREFLQHSSSSAAAVNLRDLPFLRLARKLVPSNFDDMVTYCLGLETPSYTFNEAKK